jgi:hypothetical protein
VALEGKSRQKNSRKLAKNDAMFTIYTLGRFGIVLIINELFFPCTIIGAIDGEGGWGKGRDQDWENCLIEFLLFHGRCRGEIRLRVVEDADRGTHVSIVRFWVVIIGRLQSCRIPMEKMVLTDLGPVSEVVAINLW